MIRFATGDILTADTEGVVNAVNCVGVMGRGLALQFKYAFPSNFDAYAAACKRGEVRPGKMFVFDSGHSAARRFIINFPTKRHWRELSRLEDIETGLQALAGEVRTLGIKSIAMPPLGCGLGGLDWALVRPRIEQAFVNMGQVDIVVFEPHEVADLKERKAEEA